MNFFTIMMDNNNNNHNISSIDNNRNISDEYDNEHGDDNRDVFKKNFAKLVHRECELLEKNLNEQVTEAHLKNTKTLTLMIDCHIVSFNSVTSIDLDKTFGKNQFMPVQIVEEVAAARRCSSRLKKLNNSSSSSNSEKTRFVVKPLSKSMQVSPSPVSSSNFKAFWDTMATQFPTDLETLMSARLPVTAVFLTEYYPSEETTNLTIDDLYGDDLKIVQAANLAGATLSLIKIVFVLDPQRNMTIRTLAQLPRGVNMCNLVFYAAPKYMSRCIEFVNYNIDYTTDVLETENDFRTCTTYICLINFKRQ